MSWSYAVRDGIAGFRRAKIAAIGSIITITIALLLLGVFYVISINTSRIIQNLRAKVELEAFLEEPVSRQRTGEIQTQIQHIDGIDSVRLISKEEAARIFKLEFGEDIGRVLDFNPLPPSIKIYMNEEFRSTETVAAINKKIQSIKGVGNTIYRRDLLEFLDRRTKTLFLIGLALGVLLGLCAIFLVSNTIRLTIYAKRKAIETMKLVGATRGFIRTPFLVEGVAQGVSGGIIAALILYYIVNSIAGVISSDLAGFVRIDFTFYLIVIIVGALLGYIGSFISVRRFIGEKVIA